MALRRARTFIRKGRKNRVLKIVREHYLREDIYCGSSLCAECADAASRPLSDAPLGDLRNTSWIPRHLESSDAKVQYVVVDTNVALHQLDVLRDAAFTNVVFLQTVLNETRHRSYSAYKTLREEVLADADRHCSVFSNEHHKSTYLPRNRGETANDYNDRCIRIAAQWLDTHLGPHVSVLLLTNDADNRRKALDIGLRASTVEDYVRKELAEAHPHLLEVLAASEDADQDDRGNAQSSSSSASINTKYLPMAQLKLLVQQGKLFEGTFLCRNFWQYGQIGVHGSTSAALRGADTILVEGRENVNRAVTGDRVAVQLLPSSAWKKVTIFDNATKKKEERLRPMGRVVGVLERRWKGLCGSLQLTDKKAGSVLFVAVNKCVPKVKIQSRQIERLMDQRIVVQIDAWPQHSAFPLGHYVKTIGPIGDRDTETRVLLMEHDVKDEPFSVNVLRCLPPPDWRIPESEVLKRVDLRESHVVFSIDPPGCKDIDDALHAHQLPNGNYEVGVHIADVTFFVEPECALDIEAQRRATSVYLVDRRIDMIPTRLSTDLCSLVGGVDRLAFSVFWEMTPDGDIVKTWFRRTVIRSAAALAYKQAQELLDSGDTSTAIGRGCNTLGRFARILRARRVAAGALLLASPEVKFLLDHDSQKPQDVEMYQLREANALVEEFMLLANTSVAKQIVEHFPTHALLRRHPAPAPSRFDDLIKAAQFYNVDIRVDSSKALADSLERAVVPGYAYFSTLIRIMATRCMMQAVYFTSGDVDSEEYRHYGLALPIYTHFTSPIRRYADVVVHRLLATSLGLAPIPATLQDHPHMTQVTDNINHRYRMAQLTGRASATLYTVIFFRDKVVQETACVLEVRENGMRVLVPRYGIEHYVSVGQRRGRRRPGHDDDDDDDAATTTGPKTTEFNEDKMELRDLTTGATYRVFDRVRVQISVQKSEMRREWLQVDLLGRVDKDADVGDDDDDSKMQIEVDLDEPTAAGGTKRRSTGATATTSTSEQPTKKQKKKKKRSKSRK